MTLTATRRQMHAGAATIVGTLLFSCCASAILFSGSALLVHARALLCLLLRSSPLLRRPCLFLRLTPLL